MVRTALIGLVGLGLFLGSCLGLTGCSLAPEESPGKRPPTVTVSYPLQREVTDYQDYTGRTAAIDSVQIRARVTGYLVKLYFQDGGSVKEGDVLAEIDPRPYQALFDQAQGQLHVNQASLKLARANLKRGEQLAPDGGISKEDLDQRRAAVEQAEGSIDVARANLETARLNLGWTKVTAPVSGHISYRLVTIGNLITADQTILTTIVSQDPMWAYFDVDEPTVLQVQDLIRQGKFAAAGTDVAKVPVYLQRSNEKGFPHKATMDFVNNQLDQATATLLLRAVFRNPKPATGPRVFAPNMFVRVRLPTSGPYQALLVNPEAVGTDQDLKYLYVVDNDNKVVRHAVKLGSLQDGLQVIAEGLRPGERVIVSGLQRVKQGAIVEPKLVPMPIPTRGEPPTTVTPVLKAPAPSAKK